MTKKTLIGCIVAAAVLVGGFFLLNSYIYDEKQAVATEDHKDAEYIVGGERVRLQDGVAEMEAAPGSASKITTRYFGNEARTDLDGDGREDVAFILTQDGGGSGTFYYVAAALNTERGYVGSEAMLLGDRIAPQTTEKGPGKTIIVNYADRAAGEDFSVPPSVAKSLRLLLDPQSMQFGEVASDFEGEADPSRMTLGMKTWVWISAMKEGKEINPKKAGAFTLTFAAGRFTAKTDCNSMAGKYASSGETISFSEIISTKMYCEGSQENDFASLLEAARKYHFTSRGELVLDLEKGSATFK